MVRQLRQWTSTREIALLTQTVYKSICARIRLQNRVAQQIMNAPFDRVSSGSPRRRPARVLRKPSLRANNTARRPIPRQLAARNGTQSTCALLALFPAPITNQSRLSSSITAGLVECIVYRTSPPGVLERPSTRN